MKVMFRYSILACALIILISGRWAWAASVTWVPDADGLWTTATNWSSTPALPGAADDVTIGLAGDRLITLSGGSTQTINSLLSSERLTISASTLAVGTTAQVSNTLTLTGAATLRGGAYTISGASMVVQNGIFDGIAVNGPIDLTTVSNASLRVLNSLTLNGTLSQGKADASTYASLNFGNTGVAAGSLAGTGTIVLGGDSNNNNIYNDSNLQDSDGTLTIGSGITIRGKGGKILNSFATGTILNQGTIAADVAAGTITLGNVTGALLNQGTLSVSNNGTLTINGAWSSSGALSVNTGTLNLGGSFSQAGMGNFTRSGGTVNLTGTETGNLVLDASTGSWNLTSTATIRNGAYSASGGASLVVLGGTIDAVTANAALDLTTVSNINLRILNGLTLNSTLSLGKADSSTYAYLNFGNNGIASGALTGTGTVVLGGDVNNNNIVNDSNLIGPAGILTIGSGITIRGKGGKITNSFASGMIVNQGTISADVAAGTVTLGNGTGTFVNQGALSALNGATLALSGAWSNATGGTVTATGSTLNVGNGANTWNNVGTIGVTNSTVNLGGGFTQAGLGTFTRTGGTVNLIGTLNGNLSLDASTGSWNLISGGTLRNGVYAASGGAALSVQNGTFDGVTANSPLDLTAISNTQFRVLNGLTLNSTLSQGRADGGTYASVNFGNTGVASGSLTGTGTLIFGGDANNNNLYNDSNFIGPAGTLTIGSGITIRGKGGKLINSFASGTIVNQGTISADVASGILTFGNGTGTVMNQGTLAASNGATLNVSGLSGNTSTATVTGTNSQLTLNGTYVNNLGLTAPTGTTLTLNGTWTNPSGSTINATGATLNLGNAGNSWSNAGTIAVTNSTVNLGGNLTQAAVGTFTRSGGTVNMNGALTGNLTLDASTGSWNVTSGGTLRNGTYTGTSGAALGVLSGVFDGITANGPLDLTIVSNTQLRVLNGLTLNGTLSHGRADGGTYAAVNFGDTGVAAGALSGSGTVVFGGDTNNNNIYNDSNQIGSIGTLTIGSGITIRGKGGKLINSFASGTILNQGTISADVAGGTLTLGNGTGTVVNQGTLAASNGATLNVNGLNGNLGTATLTGTNSQMTLNGTYVNNLGLAVPTGTTLTLNGNWSGTAGLAASGGTLNLGGSFTQAGMGPFTRSGGTVNISGLLTGNLSLDASTGSWNMAASSILRNGTYAASGGASLIVQSATLDGVTANGPLDLNAVSNTSLRVLNNLILNNTLSLGKADGSTYATLYLSTSGAAAGSLSGTGTIVFGGDANNNNLYNDSNQIGVTGTLTIAPGITIRGKSGKITNSYATGTILNQGTISADVASGTLTLGTANGTVVNQGTLSALNGDTLNVNGAWSNAAGGAVTATGSTLNLGSGTSSWSNAGTINTTNSTVNLGGNFTPVGLGGFIRSGGSVNLVGTLTGNLALDASSGSWNLNGGTIRNGTFTAGGGSSLVVLSGTVDGVSVGAGSVLDETTVSNASLRAMNNLSLDGMLNVGKADGSTYGTVYFGSSGSAAGALSGAGSILFGGSTNNILYNDSNQIGSTATLTIGSGITIHGKTTKIVNSFAGGTIINQGTISADVTAGTITFGNGTGTLVNQGMLSASNGGTLTIVGPWSNTGTLIENGGTLNLGGPITTVGLGLAGFSRMGGTVNLSGALDNTGATLALDAARGSWGLTNAGSITGGTVNLTGGSRLIVDNGRLSNVVVNGDIDVNSGGLTFNGLTLIGIARINAGGFTSGITQTLLGTPTLLFQGSGSDSIAAGTTLTFPSAVTTRGGGASIGGGGTLANQGLISADAAGQTLTLSLSNLTNSTTGIIEAAGGNLTISSTNFTNNGTLRATGGTLTINSGVALNNTASSSVIINGGTIAFSSTATAPSLSLAVGALSGSGNFSTPTFNWLGGTMSGSGKTTVASGATMTISGTGSKTLSRTIDNSGTTSWTDGQILTSSGTFNNLAGGVFSVTAANSFFNSGGTNLFSNTGAFAKNSPSVTVFGIPFTNQAAGVVNVNDGTLALLGGGTNFGLISVAAGATARFGGTFVHAAGSTLSGTGNVDFNTPGITLNGNLIIDGELTFNSASATVAAGATVTKLSLTGSTANVAAGGVLTVGSGGVNFTGSTNNTVTLQPSATTPGMLVLKGNVNYTATDGTAVLNTANFVAGQTPGLMDLFGATRTFSISDGAQAIDLSVSGRVSNGGIIKSGAGTMRLDSPNTYTGGTTISAGTLEVLDPAGLSTGNVTIGDATLSLKSDLASPVIFGNNVSVTGDATVNVDRISVGTSGVYRLGNVSIGGTRLSVTGANRSLEIGGLALSGAATLNTAVPLTINGPITESVAGMGITKSTGTAKLTIGGSTANTYTGLTRINAGPVELNKPAGVTAVGGDLQVFGGSVKLLADQQIANTGAVSVANAGSLIDFAGHSETMGAMSVTGNASATVGATGTASQLGTAMLRVTSLAVNTGGKLDLANNRLIDDYTGSTPITSIRTAISAGYAGGLWNGPGIQSSSAIANPTRALGYADASDVLAFANGATSDTFLGSTVDKTTLLVRYTLSGDANLDGVVDFLDLSRLAQSYNVIDGTRTWAQGDYNYDGNVDFTDLAKLAQNYNTTLPGGAAIPGAPAGFEADLARAFAEVPEPSSLVMLTGLAALALGRRRRVNDRD